MRLRAGQGKPRLDGLVEEPANIVRQEDASEEARLRAQAAVSENEQRLLRIRKRVKEYIRA